MRQAALQTSRAASPPARPPPQAKLRIGPVDDPLEREADRIADAVISDRAPEPVGRTDSGAVQRKCAQCDEEEGSVLRRAADQVSVRNAAPRAADAAAAMGQAGRPLPPDLRAYFEPRFGRDLSHVRLHTHAAAARGAQGIGAKAYTLGRDIGFAPGTFSPGARSGRRLIAHELAHVLQQETRLDGVIRRAEVDDRPSVCATLTDIESDIDKQANAEIKAARTAVGIKTPATDASVPGKTKGMLLKEVASRLGGLIDPISPIEKFIVGLPAKKRFLPPKSLAGTKFAGAEAVEKFYLLHTKDVAHVVGSTAKVKGVCIGADKLGHFFQQGFDYAVQLVGGAKASEAESTGRFGEIGVFGLSATGVFSNADLAANLAGLKFYNDLATKPATFAFGIASYIANDWNEQFNPSFYTSTLAPVVWRNLLAGKWSGSFDNGAGSTATALTADLTVDAANKVAGSYEYGGKPVRGKIANGAMTQRTTKVSGSRDGSTETATPVSSLTIDFDWEEPSRKGKGSWSTVRENRLEGAWGAKSSRSGGGAWRMDKA